MSKPKSVMLEVKSASGFNRYHIRYFEDNITPRDIYPYYRKLGPLEYTGEECDDEDEIRELYISVMKNKLMHDGFNIYYRKAAAIYKSIDKSVVVELNDTNGVLFNTPLNLLLLAACTHSPETTYRLDTGNTIKLVRHHAGVEVVVVGSVVRYQVLSDTLLTFNELSPRCIQFAHVAQLLRCPEFIENINNGNLLLAYADTCMGNLDDDVIDGDVFTAATRYNVYYDQFTGSIPDNFIVVTPRYGITDIYQGEYESNLLDSRLVELLHRSMSYWVKLPSE